jgi:hypothetical protein
MWGVPGKQASGIVLDTLTYTNQNINITANDCKSQADSGCEIVNIEYPVFKGAAILNDAVSSTLIKTLGLYNKIDTNLNQVSQTFVKSYTAFKSQQRKSSIIYSLMGKGKVIRQDSSLVTLQLNGYIFQGGAHGGSSVQFINWNTKANKNITLSDILVNGYEEKLTAVADTIFRKSEKLSDTSSLKHDYFFKDGKFALNNNFLITPVGLRFLYNQYEIKPYAAGQTNLLVPYAKIKSLLLPHTVVSQYIK